MKKPPRVQPLSKEIVDESLLVLGGVKTLAQFRNENKLNTSSCYSLFFRASREAFRTGKLKIKM